MAVVPRFSLAPDLSVSRLCLGTMTFGEQNSLADSFRLLDLAFSSSINFFDSAEMYPVPQRADTQGRSEEYLGRWIRDRRIPRDKLVIATKVTGPSGQMTWIRGGPACLDTQNISEAIDGSLLRLQTDYIDLYQIHWPDRYVPMFGELEYDTSRQFAAVSVEEQLEALGKAVTSGKIRHIGLSNETPYGIMKFLQVAEEVAPNLKIISVQNSYSLLCRTFDSGLAECCHHESFADTEMRISKLRDIFSRESSEGVNITHTINESNFCNILQRISLLAYSPLAMGILSGKYFQSDGGPADARLNLFKGRYSEGESRYNLSKKTVAAAAKGYLRIAKKYGLNPVELAIAFVLRHPQVASAMFGATKLWQLREVISSCDTKLTLEVIGEIDTVHEEFPNPCP